MPKLIINPGTSRTKEIDLQPGKYLVGRAAGNDIRIEDASLSLTHAQLVFDQGIITIKDLNSTNGTFVNGSPVKYGELKPGQLLRFGWVDVALIGDPVVKTMVAGVPIPSEIAAEALEAARRRRGHSPGP